VHQGVERVAVDGEPGLFDDLHREIDREAVGVVQQERLRAADRGGPASLAAAIEASRFSEPAASVRRNVASSARA
jgi:hypothetical protein